MPKKAEYVAREMCIERGLDPDQIVVEFDPRTSMEHLKLGVVPVNIAKLFPLFMKFMGSAERRLREAVFEDAQ